MAPSAASSALEASASAIPASRCFCRTGLSGVAVALAFGGVGIGSIIILPWVQLLIDKSGWRAASWAMGILVLVVLIPLNLLLHKRPEDIGLLPDGDAAPTATSAKPVSYIVDPVWAGTDWTLRRAL